jgi:bifunctional DNA-binding transcriptional regulator/antitoxin component of YhaV-PrlF toxin-antitoxin module
MIKLLGQITIPQKLLDDVKNREPDRIVKHVDGKSHAQNVVDLANDWPVENYAHYDNDHCLIREYCKEWYKDVIPDVFLQEHGIAKPDNVIVLRVDPATFSVPHVDKFNHALRMNPNFNIDEVVRLWIPLEDNTFGQALFVGEQVLTKYSAGDVYSFDNLIHSAANAGLHTRYTMIVYTKKVDKV